MTQQNYHAIFVDSNYDWRYYKNLQKFSLSPADSLLYHEILALERPKYKRSIDQTTTLNKCPKVWYQLNIYEGKLYLYEPNDNGYNTNIVLTDSSFLRFNMDGPDPRIIDSAQILNAQSYRLFLPGINQMVDTLSIYILDWNTRLALFDYHASYGIRYRLMVASEASNLYPVIVNYSSRQKSREYIFPAINFDLFLEQLQLK